MQLSRQQTAKQIASVFNCTYILHKLTIVNLCFIRYTKQEDDCSTVTLSSSHTKQ